jgi:hypothetical protein
LQPSEVNNSTTGVAVGPLRALQLGGVVTAVTAACASEAASEAPSVRPVASKEKEGGRM